MQKSTSYKNVTGKVVAQSIAFRVVSIYWQLRSLDIWTQRDRPTLEAPALHTLRLIVRQAWCHCVTSLSAHWLASSLKFAARCPVSGCWRSCQITHVQSRTILEDHTTHLFYRTPNLTEVDQSSLHLIEFCVMHMANTRENLVKFQHRGPKIVGKMSWFWKFWNFQEVGKVHCSQQPLPSPRFTISGANIP